LKYVWWLLSNLDIEPHKICLYALEHAENFEELFTMFAGIFIDMPLEPLQDTFITWEELLNDSKEERNIFLENLFLAKIYALRAVHAITHKKTYSPPNNCSLPLFQHQIWSVAKLLDIPLDDSYLTGV
jgi:hypothetical protein